MQKHDPSNFDTPLRRQTVVRVDLDVVTVVKILLVLACAWLLIRLLPIVLVLIAALMIMGTLNPVVQWLEARSVTRNLAIWMVFGSLIIVVAVVIIFGLPTFLAQLKNLIDQAAALRMQLADFLAGIPLLESLATSLRELHYDAVIKSLLGSLVSVSTRVIEILTYTVGTVFLALYMMIERDRLRGALFAVVPRRHHVRLSRIIINLQTIVGGYIRAQVITSACMGVFMFILLTACGVPGALVLAVVASIADVLPVVGIFLTIGPAVLAAVPQGLTITAIVFAMMVAYEEFENRVLVPMVYGRALRLPSSVVIFSLLAGGALMGVIGALLSLPVAATVMMLIDELGVELPGEEEQIEDRILKSKKRRSEQQYERRTEGMPAKEAAPVAVEIAENTIKKGDSVSGITPPV